MAQERPNMMVSMFTFGCKLNQAESAELKKELTRLGFTVVAIESGESVAIVRACAVTCGASRSVREMIRRLKRNGAYVIVSGCLENKGLKEIDYVAKNNDEIIEHLANFSESQYHLKEKGKAIISNVKNRKKISAVLEDRTRALIKIQTGCNFNCSYCIIPFFRGQANSIKTNEIVNQVKQAQANKYQEVVLTGVNICLYRDGDVNLAKLLKKILTETTIPQIRLGSLDPRLITDELINIYAKNPDRLLPHWHLSLQSGSNKILKSMNRLYTAADYLKIVEALRKNNPTFSVTTDIIVGFPGEEEKDFTDTSELVKKVEFSKVHIFPFSSRPGTPAANLKNQVHDKIKTERAKKLKNITTITAREFIQKMSGQKKAVLWESRQNGYWQGYTPEYIRVKCKSTKNLKNKITEIEMKKENLVN